MTVAEANVRTKNLVAQHNADYTLLHRAEAARGEVNQMQSTMGLRRRYAWLQQNNEISVRLRREIKKDTSKAAGVGMVVFGLGSLALFALPLPSCVPVWAVGAVRAVRAISKAYKAVTVIGSIAAGGVVGGAGTYLFRLTTLRTSDLFRRSIQSQSLETFQTRAFRAAERDGRSYFDLQSLTEHVDRRLVCPITLFFPRFPVTIRGQSYEMNALRDAVQRAPEENNSPIRDGHIDLEETGVYDLTYFLRWSVEMVRLATTRPDWVNAEVGHFIETEINIHHRDQNEVVLRLRDEIVREFQRNANITAEDLREYLTIADAFAIADEDRPATAAIPVPAPAAAAGVSVPIVASASTTTEDRPAPAAEAGVPVTAAAAASTTTAIRSIPDYGVPFDDGVTFDDEADATAAVADAIGDEVERLIRHPRMADAVQGPAFAAVAAGVPPAAAAVPVPAPAAVS